MSPTETVVPGNISVQLISINGTPVPMNAPVIDVSLNAPVAVKVDITNKPSVETVIYIQEVSNNVLVGDKTSLIVTSLNPSGTKDDTIDMTTYTIPSDKIKTVPNGQYLMTVETTSKDGDSYSSSQLVTIQNSTAAVSTPVPLSDTLSIPKDQPFFPYPNPANGKTDVKVKFYVTKDASSVTFKMYTPASRLIRNLDVPVKMFNDGLTSTIKAGNNTVTIPAESFAGLANGTYYYLIIVKDSSGNTAKSKIDKIVLIK
jgi:hypothetical protein